jgi:signal recognition particle subunit SRP54
MNGSRRARVSRGSGRPVSEINRLLKQFEQMRKMMKSAGKGGMKLPMGGGMPFGPR